MNGAIRSKATQGKTDRAVDQRLALAGNDPAKLAALLTLSKSNAKLKMTGKAIKAIGLQEFSSQIGFPLRGHNIAAFNLPAGGYTLRGESFKVCIGAGACLALCYAMQGRYGMSTSQAPRVVNHQTLLRLNGAYSNGVIKALDGMVKRLGRSFGLVRLHDSGDFFADWYAYAWLIVARMNPDILFYCYTKSHTIFPDHTTAPANLRIVRSYGGKRDDLIDDDKPHARIFESVKALKDAGYINANDEVDGEIATIAGEQRIGLAYHGTRKPTPAQLRAVA